MIKILTTPYALKKELWKKRNVIFQLKHYLYMLPVVPANALAYFTPLTNYQVNDIVCCSYRGTYYPALKITHAWAYNYEYLKNTLYSYRLVDEMNNVEIKTTAVYGKILKYIDPNDPKLITIENFRYYNEFNDLIPKYRRDLIQKLNKQKRLAK